MGGKLGAAAVPPSCYIGFIKSWFLFPCLPLSFPPFILNCKLFVCLFFKKKLCCLERMHITVWKKHPASSSSAHAIFWTQERRLYRICIIQEARREQSPAVHSCWMTVLVTQFPLLICRVSLWALAGDGAKPASSASPEAPLFAFSLLHKLNL